MANKPHDFNRQSSFSPDGRPVSSSPGSRTWSASGARDLTPLLCSLVVLVAVVAASAGEAAAKRKPPGSQPVIASTCKKSYVRKFLIEAAKYADGAAQHLAKLGADLKRIRSRQWYSEVEPTWFGKYSSARTNTAVKWLRKAVETLSSSSLTVNCSKKVNKWEVTRYRRKEILLGKRWIDLASKSRYKLQALIRGAAHVAGALRGERQEIVKRQTTRDLDMGAMAWAMSFGWDRAHKHPAYAVRTANNLGFYAVCHKQRGACGEMIR